MTTSSGLHFESYSHTHLAHVNVALNGLRLHSEFVDEHSDPSSEPLSLLKPLSLRILCGVSNPEGYRIVIVRRVDNTRTEVLLCS